MRETASREVQSLVIFLSLFPPFSLLFFGLKRKKWEVDPAGGFVLVDGSGSDNRT